MIKWLEGPSKDEDVVISSRIRIARNIKGYKFPNKLSFKESEELTESILNSIKEGLDDNYSFTRTLDLNDRDQKAYVEKHLISPNLVENKDKSSFLIRKDEKSTIMINEEDHLRFQTLSPGLNLKKSWEECSKLDDLIENNIRYSYDRDLGYLTSCPSNVGTGLRASVMLHLPCITMTNNMDDLVRSLSKIGITTRGIYGEGSQIIGDVYQISNQRTLGSSEEDIIEKLDSIITEIINRERDIRNYLKNTKSIDIEDRIYRSYGVLKHSRMIDAKEAMIHLSNIRTGWEMELFKSPQFKEIAKLMMNIQPYNIQNFYNLDMRKKDRDIKRSELIREFINKMEG